MPTMGSRGWMWDPVGGVSNSPERMRAKIQVDDGVMEEGNGYKDI